MSNYIEILVSGISIVFFFRGEDVLLFLVQTVGRQQHEQKQHTRRLRSTVVRKSNNAAADADPAIPEHDLEPPKFARRALERILNDWTAVKSMLMNGYSAQQEEGSRFVLFLIHIEISAARVNKVYLIIVHQQIACTDKPALT